MANCLCTHENVILVFISLVAKQRVKKNSKITLEWVHKQLDMTVHTLLYFWHDIMDPYTMIKRQSSHINPISLFLSSTPVLTVSIDVVFILSILKTFILYADDTTLFSTIKYSIPSSASNYHQTINLNLSKVTDWLIANRLSLNVKKTKYMLFHPYQKDITQVTPRLMLNND